VTHLTQSPAAAAGLACIRVGTEGRHGVDAGHGTAWDTKRTWAMLRRVGYGVARAMV